MDKFFRIIQTIKNPVIPKRQVFVLSTILLTIILLLTQVVSQDFRYAFVLFLSVCTYVVSAYALREDLTGIEWMTLLILPALYSAGVSLFYFLLPVRWLTRIPVAIIYAFGFYALLLTENIFNVAANRTIALLRAAHSVGFLITFLTYLLLSQIIFAFRLGPTFNALGIAVLSFLLIFQSLWVMELTEKVSRRVVILSIVLTLVLSEFSFMISLWPAQPLMRSLFLSSLFYSLTGMTQQYVVERMYKKTVIEFLVVTIVVFIIFLATSSWRAAV
jgi:hypothetical protein